MDNTLKNTLKHTRKKPLNRKPMEILNSNPDFQLVHNPNDAAGYFVMAAVRNRPSGEIAFYQQVSRNYIRRGWAERKLREQIADKNRQREQVLSALVASGIL